MLERRSVLERVVKPREGVQLGSYVEDEGKALFHLTKEKGMEGIIAKRKDSIYRPGKRTSDWLKTKARLQQEFVVGGFTSFTKRLKALSALVPSRGWKSSFGILAQATVRNDNKTPNTPRA